MPHEVLIGAGPIEITSSAGRARRGASCRVGHEGSSVLEARKVFLQARRTGVHMSSKNSPLLVQRTLH